MVYHLHLNLVDRVISCSCVKDLIQTRQFIGRPNQIEIHWRSKGNVYVFFPESDSADTGDEKAQSYYSLLIQVKPGGMHRFPIESRWREIKIMQNEFFLLPDYIGVQSYHMIRMELLLIALRDQPDRKTLQDFLRFLNFIAWNQLIPMSISEYHIFTAYSYVMWNCIYPDRMNVANIAMKCGLTPNYFSMIFHRATGRRAKDVLKLVQLSYARFLMQEYPNATGTEIAKKSGLQNYKAMRQLFEREFYKSIEQCVEEDTRQGGWRVKTGILFLLYEHE